MTCKRFEELFLRGRRAEQLNVEAQEHLRTCAECSGLLALMESAPADELDPAVIRRVTQSIVPSIQPVRPMASLPVQTLILVIACAAIAWAGAALSGFDGFFAFNVAERIVILTTLTLFAAMAARLFASEMVPGSARRIGAVWLLAAVSIAVAVEFAMFFHNYDMSGFVPDGITCLENGLLHAIPVGIAAWIVLRRGFAVEPVNAGLAAGLLAGLGGLGLLELHCPHLKVMHQAIWHIAVVPVSAVVGAALGRVDQRVRN